MYHRRHVFPEPLPMHFSPLLALLRKRMHLSREVSDDVVRARGGVYTMYFYDNTIQSHRPYLDNMRHGTTRWYSHSGTLHGVLHFIEGNRHGRTRWWWADSTVLQQDSCYVNDRLHGVSRHYDITGLLSYEVKYDHGTVTSRTELPI